MAQKGAVISHIMGDEAHWQHCRYDVMLAVPIGQVVSGGMMTEFRLHERLAADCIPAGQLPVSQLLLMNDARFPWFILVPRCAGISEVFQLSGNDQQQLWKESALLSAGLMRDFAADKINIGALGNLVPQLHVHHIARFRTDDCWPGPVWGCGASLACSEVDVRDRLAAACGWFDGQMGIP